MYELIDKVCEKTELPKWWIEGIYINNLMEDKKTEDELIEDVLYKRAIITNYKLIHNINKDSFEKRYISKEVSVDKSQLADELDGVIVKGVANDKYYAYKEKYLNINVPQNLLKAYVQIHQDGKFYQWPVQECIRECEKNADFSFMKEISELQVNYNKIICNPSSSLLEKNKYIEWYNCVKRSLTNSLYDIHLSRIEDENRESIFAKLEPIEPAGYEEIFYEDREISTRAEIGGVYYKIALENLTMIKENNLKLPKEIEYEAKITAISMALLCIEASINKIISSKIPNLYEVIDGVDLSKKIRMLVNLIDINEDDRREIDKLIEIIDNLLIIQKSIISDSHKKTKVIIKDELVKSWLNEVLDSNCILNLEETLPLALKYLYKVSKIDFPSFLI